MDIDKILELNRVELIELLHKLNLDFDTETEDLEELQAIVFSFITSCNHFDVTYELANAFGESFDLVNSLLESNSGIVDESILEQCVDLQPHLASTFEHLCVSRHAGLYKSPPRSVLLGTKLIAVEACDQTTHKAYFTTSHSSTHWTPQSVLQPIPCHRTVIENRSVVQSLCCVTSQGTVSGLHILSLPFGMHDYDVTLTRDVVTTNQPLNDLADGSDISGVSITTYETLVINNTVLVTSPVYQYTSSLDDILDTVHWSWESSEWTEALEGALLELLVAVSDDLVATVRKWSSMMSFMRTGTDRSMSDDLEHMLETIQSDVKAALTDHNSYSIGELLLECARCPGCANEVILLMVIAAAVIQPLCIHLGRLHSTLMQFLEMSSGTGGMMSVPMEVSDVRKWYYVCVTMFVFALSSSVRSIIHISIP